jgi:peptide chain release factor 2
VITFDPDALEKRVAELEEELGRPGFWDDQQRAAQVSAEHARLSKRLERYRRLTQEFEDARELLAMDGDMAAEIEASIAPLRQELDRLQEDALFSG